jgi:hypothetical protein
VAKTTEEARLLLAMGHVDRVLEIGCGIDPRYALALAAGRYHVDAGRLAAHLWCKAIQCDRARLAVRSMNEADAPGPPRAIDVRSPAVQTTGCMRRSARDVPEGGPVKTLGDLRGNRARKSIAPTRQAGLAELPEQLAGNTEAENA